VQPLWRERDERRIWDSGANILMFEWSCGQKFRPSSEYRIPECSAAIAVRGEYRDYRDVREATAEKVKPAVAYSAVCSVRSISCATLRF
jgi:hypothetical protein